MPNLLLINGSVRRNSTNGAALQAIVELLPEATLYPGIDLVPHFNPDLDPDRLPESVAQLRRAIADADALLFCTPEYAGALPGAFKNLLDWTIGGGEMSGKPVGWINCSDRGAAGAYAELETVLRYADTRKIDEACAHIPVSRPNLDADGRIVGDELRNRLVEPASALLQAASPAPL